MKRKHLLLLTLLLSQSTPVWGMDEEFSTTRHSMYSNSKSNVSTSYGFSSFMPSFDNKSSFNPSPSSSSSFMNSRPNASQFGHSFSGKSSVSHNLFEHTRIPDPSNFSYSQPSITHNTPQMRREQNETSARRAGFSAYMNTNSFGMENMGDNFPITFNPDSIDRANDAYNNYRGIPETVVFEPEEPAPYFNPWNNEDKPTPFGGTFNTYNF